MDELEKNVVVDKINALLGVVEQVKSELINLKSQLVEDVVTTFSERTKKVKNIEIDRLAEETSPRFKIFCTEHDIRSLEVLSGHYKKDGRNRVEDYRKSGEGVVQEIESVLGKYGFLNLEEKEVVDVEKIEGSAEEKKERVLNLQLETIYSQIFFPFLESEKSVTPLVKSFFKNRNSHQIWQTKTLKRFFIETSPHKTYRGFGKKTETFFLKVLANYGITKEDWKEIYRKGEIV